MQSKRISITFGQNLDPVGLSIKRLELSEGAISGIYIKGIQPNSPAARDGRLKVFDELIEVNDRPVRQYPEEQLKALFAQRGHALKLTVYRNSSAAILHGIGYPIPNDNSGEDLPSTFHSPSNSDTVEYVELHSDMRDFGFFVAPGCGEYPVVNHISPGSASQMDARLRIGDELMLVNDYHVRNVASQRVMELLQSYSDLVLKVRHVPDPVEKTPTEFRPQMPTDPKQSEIVSVVLKKDSRGSLGIMIHGVTSENTDDISPDDGIYIAKVVPEGPAALTGQVREADRIIMVNGINLRGLRPKQALAMVKKAGNPVSLVLERGLRCELDRNAVEMGGHGQEGSFNMPSVSDTSEHFPESVKSSSIHSGVSSIHGFYPSRLSEACLEFSHDPQGTMYTGLVPKEEKIRLVDLWQPRVGSEKIVKIAQLSKYSPAGEIGLEIQSEHVYNQNNELSGMRTIISGISNGPAEDDGILLEGDELLEINGVRITDVHYDDVVSLLKATPQQVRLVVARPHTRGNIPSHYLMNGSSVSSSDGESPAGTLDLPRKKVFRTSKSRNHEHSTGNMTYPRNTSLQGLMQTDLDEAGEEDIRTLREMHEHKLREQQRLLEQMESEKERLEREVFAKKGLNKEDRSQLRACLQQVKMKYEKDSTLPRPSKYSKAFPYKHHAPSLFGQSTHSCITSGIATTPRAPKTAGNLISPRESFKDPPNSLSDDNSSQLLLNRSNNSKVADLNLTPNEKDLLNLVCVPFQREPGKGQIPRALIPFPVSTHSATTSDDESVHSPNKFSFPEHTMLTTIEQETEHGLHCKCETEPQEIIVTKEETLGIGIERERDLESKGKYKIKIIAIIAGSPAAKCGLLKIGDELTSINKYSVVGKLKEEVALQITNLPKGPVVLTVIHQQQDTLTKHEKSPPAKHVSKAANQVSSPKRTYTPVASEKTYAYKRPMEKAFSLSTISDGSRIDFLGSRITHSSSNSNNSLNDNIDPYPFRMPLFPPIPQDSSVPHKAWDDFNMEQESLETEEGHKHRRSKSLDLEQKEDASSNSLDDIPTSLLDQDISVFPQGNEDQNGLSKKSNPIQRNQESHISVKEPSGHSKYTHSPPISQPQQVPSVPSEKRHSVPRGVVREVHLSRKSNANLGISIVEKFIPGVRVQNKGIFIKSITDPILLSGQLEQDDQILEVNGIDMNGFVHDQAVNLIKKASEPVILKVLHSPEFIKRISLERIAQEHAELGGEIIHSYFVTGKKGSGIVVELAKLINERVGRSYFKISEVLKRSSAEESKSIQRDDVIINVNGMNAVGIAHHQLVKLLNTPHCEVSIILSRMRRTTSSSTNNSPHEINNGKYNARSRRYLKSCLIDKLHEVEICVESQEGGNQKPIVIISSVQSKHPSFLEEIHPGDELVAINKKNLSGCKIESVQRWLFELRGTPQYEISFYSSAPHSTSTSTGSGHSYDQELSRPPAYAKQLSAQFTYVFLKEARQDVGLVLVDGKVDGVYIEEVDPNGLAAADPRIRPGCRVVAINERNLMNDEANFVDMVLNGVTGQVSLTLESSFIQKVSRKQMEAHGYFRYSSESSQDMSHSPQPPRSMAPPPQIHTDYSHKRGTRAVKLIKEGEIGFGLTLRGGANTSHGDLPLFVGKVYPHQAAFRSGQVQERDIILAINDIPTLGMTCAEAVAVLKSHKVVTLTLSDEKDPIVDIVLPHQRNSGLLNELTSSRESLRSREGFVPQTQNNSIPDRKYGYHPYHAVSTAPMHYATNVLIPAYSQNLYPDWSTQYLPTHVVPHEKLMSGSEPPPYEMISQNYIMKPDPSLIWVHLKSTQRGFGFSISGGVDNMSGPQPILIKSMTEDGAAKLDGNFAVGDEICAVNGYSLINITHQQAVSILKQCQEKLKPDQEVQLLIRKRQI